MSRPQTADLVDATGKTLTLLALALPAVGVFVRWIALGFDRADVQVAVAVSIGELAAVGAYVLFLPVISLLILLVWIRGLLPWLKVLLPLEPLVQDVRGRARGMKSTLKSTLAAVEEAGPILDETRQRQARLRERLNALKRKTSTGEISEEEAERELRDIEAETEALENSTSDLQDRLPSVIDIEQEFQALQEDFTTLQDQMRAAEEKAPGWARGLEFLGRKLKSLPRIILISVLAASGIVLVLLLPMFPALHLYVVGSFGASTLTLMIVKRTGDFHLRDAWPVAALLAVTGVAGSVVEGSVPGLSPVEVHVFDREAEPVRAYRVGESSDRVYVASCFDINDVRLVRLDRIKELRYAGGPRDFGPSLWGVIVDDQLLDLGLQSCPASDV